MGSLITKFLAGWLDAENMEYPMWLENWKKKAIEAKENNYDLYVFKIPKTKRGLGNVNPVIEIEKLLQERFPDESFKI